MSGLLAAIAGSLSAPPAATVTLDASYTISAIRIGAVASCTITFESDGDITASGNSVFPTDRGDWLSPTSSAPGLYEIRATVVSGSVSGSSTGTWLALTSNRAWTVTSPGFVGTNTAQLTVEIRNNGGSVLDSTTVNLSAEFA